MNDLELLKREFEAKYKKAEEENNLAMIFGEDFDILLFGHYKDGLCHFWISKKAISLDDVKHCIITMPSTGKFEYDVMNHSGELITYSISIENNYRGLSKLRIDWLHENYRPSVSIEIDQDVLSCLEEFLIRSTRPLSDSEISTYIGIHPDKNLDNLDRHPCIDFKTSKKIRYVGGYLRIIDEELSNSIIKHIIA